VLRAGCAGLQLRDKHSDDRTFVSLGLEIARLCEAARTPFIVNDRFWLARELSASGVHIGQTDATLEHVRKELGAGLAIGVSTHTLAQAQDAQQRGAALVGFGPVFATSSKPDADPVVGLSALAEVSAAVDIPVVAIGGITLERVAAVSRSGAACAAVISAICQAQDSAAAARALHEAMLLSN